HFRSPSPGKEIHIVLVDNGRTAQLAREKFKNSLKCIRCGACMNTCPIYRRSGGFSYGSTVPGPIGSILSPGLDMKKHSTLPFASTLCGSCSDVCPVKINMMKLANGIFKSPLAYKISGNLMRSALKALPDSMIYHPINTFGKNRNLPETPKESFQQWYQKNRA
nr:4Fe-4S binding protein [Algoriphagus sp.]